MGSGSTPHGVTPRRGSRAILLIEDNAGDVDLVRAALEQCEPTPHLIAHGTGESALGYLEACTSKPSEQLPDLVLLDLNLPGLSGHEVLREIRSREALCTLPVIVMTSSTADVDVVESYRLHANCYVEKPLDFVQLSHTLAKLTEFWLHVALTPRRVPAIRTT